MLRPLIGIKSILSLKLDQLFINPKFHENRLTCLRVRLEQTYKTINVLDELIIQQKQLFLKNTYNIIIILFKYILFLHHFFKVQCFKILRNIKYLSVFKQYNKKLYFNRNWHINRNVLDKIIKYMVMKFNVLP